MKKIFIINGGQHFAHSGGKFNHTILEWDKQYFTPENGFELKSTDINDAYDLMTEVEKFVWADIVIYHTPVWWFSIPYKLKQYIDMVFTAGHRNGIYYSDGRKSDNPDRNYGTGGSLHGRNYLLTTSWNAPETAFTLADEFFNQTSVDDGVMFGFHSMNAFTGMKKMDSFHFHDLEKNGNIERIENYRKAYLVHINQAFNKVLEQKIIS